MVSAAAGASGSIFGQLGKIQGYHVVGIAGSSEKYRGIVDEPGLGAATANICDEKNNLKM